MKAIMVMFDSLNLRMLEPYGCDWTHTPNFRRLSERALTFDNAYVGSMPCMPARREIHTGRYNFLHRSWGPLEPFDDSMPELLKQNGVYTHLTSDHYHYWEEGGCTYHTRYNSWEIQRGQEGDPWKGHVADPPQPAEIVAERGGPWPRQDWVNRLYLDIPEKQPMHLTFQRGLEFLETNRDSGNWFLQIETFDPHEPYFTHQRYKDLYPHTYNGGHFDWPPYRRVQETPEEVEHCRYESAALHSFCDEQLGRVLDLMDSHNLWEDTLLIVNTDHGFLLGEHDWWAKCAMPFYNEIAHTPLFVWDPRCGQAGQRRQSLVQTIDLAPTLLEYFGVAIPPDMQGHSLSGVLNADQPVRSAALYGIHGGHVNVTDGQHVYMRAPVRPDNGPLYEYTLMPTHMRHTFMVEELQTIDLSEGLPFTKGCPVMRIPCRSGVNAHSFGTLLFDLEQDPLQQNPLDDAVLENRMLQRLDELLRSSAAPTEQWERLGL